MKYTKGQLTDMAKKICKVNDALHNAISYCEELSYDNDIKELLKNKEQYPDEYKLLVKRIIKHTMMLSGADAQSYGRDLDDATELLMIAYEEIDIYA